MLRVLLHRPTIALVVCCSALAATDAPALDSTSPEVTALVDKAVAFLETTSEKDSRPGVRLGSEALLGRALLFAGKADHPRAVAAIEHISATIQSPPDRDPALIYALGIAAIYLSEHDAAKHRTDIDRILALLVERQKVHGGWGYANQSTGDTSMTQYAVFALWTAEQSGIVVEDEQVWMRALDWLERTQDPSGGWGYQGAVPEGAERIAQQEVRRSLTEAAMASLYLCGEHFGAWQFEQSREIKVSKLLRRVETQVDKKPPAEFDRGKLAAALALGNRWLAASSEPIYETYPYYHLYTIERFQTFRSASGGAPGTTAWYDAGVRFLQAANRRAEDGHWTGSEHNVANTSFAVLFLLRSTRASLRREADSIGAGTLVGGRGLPNPAAAPRRATPVSPGTTAPDAELSALLERLDDPRFTASLADIERIAPVGENRPPNELKQQLLRLAQSNTPEAKATALRALGRMRDLDQVPLLIEAIGDADPLVHQAAVDALRFINRDLDNYGKPVPPDAGLRGAEARKWMQWYRSIRPAGR